MRGAMAGADGTDEDGNTEVARGTTGEFILPLKGWIRHQKTHHRSSQIVYII